MKKLFEEYGSVIVVVIAIVALITLVITLMQPSGPMGQAFDSIIQSFVDKTTGAIGGEGGAGGAGGAGGSGGEAQEYTITYYDSDETTVLHTEQVAHGVVPSYEPTKDGYTFVEWTPAPVAATEDTSYSALWEIGGSCGEGVTWRFDADTGVLTISGSGDMYDFANADSVPWVDHKTDIASVVIESGVTSVGAYSFSGCTSLTAATIPSGVAKIGRNAFHNCSTITSIYLPATVTSIGQAAFNGCKKLSSVNIPSGVTEIPASCFYYCKFSSITIPDGVTTIGNSAFAMNFNLKTINIPTSVTAIGQGAFSNTNALTTVTMATGTDWERNWYYTSTKDATSGRSLNTTNGWAYRLRTEYVNYYLYNPARWE